MAGWHVAGSLEQLRAQINAIAPNRSTLSDGGIGNAEHASRNSDHNPWYENTVTARDFTHDPARGMDCEKLVQALVQSGDPRVKYVIWNRRIWTPARGWRPYTGPNPHTKHAHVSVVASPLCESRTPWRLWTAPAQPPSARPAEPPSAGPAPVGGAADLPTLRHGDTGPAVAALQGFMRRAFPSYAGGLPVTGNYLDMTQAVMMEYQGRVGITKDGVTGPATNGHLWGHGYRGA